MINELINRHKEYLTMFD